MLEYIRIGRNRRSANSFENLLRGIRTSVDVDVTPLKLTPQIISFIILPGFRLEDNGIITECNLKTLETDSLINFEFDFDNVVNKVIIKVIRTNWFRPLVFVPNSVI